MKVTCRVLGGILLLLAGLLGPVPPVGAAVPTISGMVGSLKGPVSKGQVYFFATCQDYANRTSTAVATIKSGTYSALVPPGTYRIFIDVAGVTTAADSWHSGAATCEQAMVVTISGDASLDLVAAPLFTLSGTVRNSDGPIANAWITVYRSCEQLDGLQWVRAASADANGAYNLGLPAGTYRVHIKAALGELMPGPSSWHHAQLHCTDATEVVVGQDATLDLVALPSATASGTVSSFNGTENQAEVRFYASCADYARDEQQGITYRAAAKALLDNGSYTVLVASGAYRVFVIPFGSQIGLASWHSEASTCEQASEVFVAGAATVPLRIRGIGNVTGTVKAGKSPVAQGSLTFFTACPPIRQGSFSFSAWFTGGSFTATIPDGSYVVKIGSTVARDSWHKGASSCDAATPVVVHGRTGLDIVGLTSAQSVTRPPKKLQRGKRVALARQTDRKSRVTWNSLTKRVCTVRKYKLRGLRKGQCRVSVQTTRFVLGLDAVSRKFTIRIV